MKIPNSSADSEGVYQKHIESKCYCAKSETRLRTKRNGQTAIYKQCKTCGSSVGNPIAKKNYSNDELEKLPIWDEQLSFKYNNKRNESLQLAQQAEEERSSNEWWNHYNSYLDSHEWKKVRKRVLERDKWLCQGCLEKQASQVHHLTYEHAGEELLFELISVCDSCHDRLHADNDEQDS